MIMQLEVTINLQEPLVLPLNYNHIIQSIIYRALSAMPDYSEFLHEYGYGIGSRQYKMFQFSQLNGDYYVDQKHRKIVFRSYVTFEVRSPEPLLINLLAMSFQYQGVTFGTMNCRDIHLELYDYTVEETELHIRMKTPLTVYSTDYDTKRTYFYSPEEPEFYQKIVDNFRRKYEAFYGVRSFQPITLTYIGEKLPRKLVTRYQGSYINAWYGTYKLSGKRKYLDFLYQTGLGSKNAQGFGMFEIN